MMFFATLGKEGNCKNSHLSFYYYYYYFITIIIIYFDILFEEEFFFTFVFSNVVLLVCEIY